MTSTPQQVETAVHQFLHPAGAPARADSERRDFRVGAPAARAKVERSPCSTARGAAASPPVSAGSCEGAGYRATVGGNASSFSFTTTSVAGDASSLAVARRLAALLAPARLQVLGSTAASGQVTVTVGSSFSGTLGTAAAARANHTAASSTAPPYDAAEWRALQRRTSLPLYAPSSWPAGLGYQQFRAYRVTVGRITSEPRS